MTSKFVNVTNFKKESKFPDIDVTGVAGATLQHLKEDELCVIRLKPNFHQKPHYHTFADIDVFMIAQGSGYLHLAKIENDRIVKGSEEKISLVEGDTYSIPPYVLHSIGAKDEGLTYLNISHETHGLPVEEETHRRAVDVFFPFE